MRLGHRRHLNGLLLRTSTSTSRQPLQRPCTVRVSAASAWLSARPLIGTVQRLLYCTSGGHGPVWKRGRRLVQRRLPTGLLSVQSVHHGNKATLPFVRAVAIHFAAAAQPVVFASSRHSSIPSEIVAAAPAVAAETGSTKKRTNGGAATI